MNKIQILDFDTQLFGFKVGMFTGKTLTSEGARELIRECKDNEIRCLYVDFDIDDFATLSIAVKYNFTISDIRISLQKNLPDFEKDKKITVRGYQVEDAPRSSDASHLDELSREISKVSRFVFDEKFPKGSAGHVYALWMRNSIRGKVADKVFIARETRNKKPIGVVTCINKSDHGEIVLVGVAKEHSQRGVGSLILSHACSYFRRNGLSQVRTKTEGRNIHALRFYQKNGFFVQKISLFFHLWLE